MTDFLTISDLTHILKVSRSTIKKWRKNKILPPELVIGGVIRWRASDIEAWKGEAVNNDGVR